MQVKRFHFVAVVALALAFGRPILAQERAERPHVAAATAEAATKLQAQIEQEPIGHITVGELVRRSHAEAEFRSAIERAEVVGGPRWLDSDTCQVQLEMSGRRIARVIEHMAASNPDRSQVSKDD